MTSSRECFSSTDDRAPDRNIRVRTEAGHCMYKLMISCRASKLHVGASSKIEATHDSVA
ncbi:MAG: hypothetical protein GDA43_15140 [Hormoscilla sp. SP5CHS1]|nr:hypothetical protein [Hormoscilla sp. SP12CHS1]MBC6454365.1 hypothetical protein [Hormoscilla sp. SP5CHS1]